MGRGLREAAVAAAAALLAAAAPAHASFLVDGAATRAQVAFDAAGTAHVVLAGPAGLRACALGPADQGCPARQDLAGPLPAPADSALRLLSLGPAPGGGVALATVDAAWTAAPGATFGPPVALRPPAPGVRPAVSPTAVAALLPGDPNLRTPVRFVARPLDGAPAAGAGAELFDPPPPDEPTPKGFSFTHGQVLAVGYVDDATPVAIQQTDLVSRTLRRYTGVGDVDDAASWTAPVPMEVIRGVPWMRVVSGGGRALLAEHADVGGRRDGIALRAWTGTTFGPAATVPIREDVLDQAIAVAPGGRIVVVYLSAGAITRVRELHSDDGGASWSAPATLACGAARVQPPDVAAGPGGRGLAVYTDKDGVRAVALDAVLAGCPLRSGSVTVRGATYRLAARPHESRRGNLLLTVTRRGGGRVRPRGVTFALPDGGRAPTRRGRLRVAILCPARLQPGAIYEVTARLRFGGRIGTRTIRGETPVCASAR